MDKDTRSIINFVVGMSAGIVLFFALLALGIAHFGAIGQVAEYQQLKGLVAELGIDARSEDILGKVADVNMSLANCKRYNRIPIIQFWIPDKLADLEPIEIPKRKE